MSETTILAKFQYQYTVFVVWILIVLNSSITDSIDHDDTTLNNVSSYKSRQMDSYTYAIRRNLGTHYRIAMVYDSVTILRMVINNNIM